jgi:hypothetical protein
MTEISSQDEKLLKGFRYLNKFMLLLWRSGLGNWLNMFPPTLDVRQAPVTRPRSITRSTMARCIAPPGLAQKLIGIKT